MNEAQRQSIAAQLARYPEVRWDRFAELPNGDGMAFGWLDRDDDHADFVRIEWAAHPDGSTGFGISTSSAEHSLEFAQRLYGPGAEHYDCQRVEDRFGDLVANVIRL